MCGSLISCICPCFNCFNTERQKKKRKPKKTRDKSVTKSFELATQDWMRHPSKLTPEMINDEHLTQVFRVPDDYPTEEECIRAQGFAPNFSYDYKLGEKDQEVYKVTDLSSKKLVACKIIKLTEEFDLELRSAKKFRQLKGELYALAHGNRHKNIIEMLANFIITNTEEHKENCYIFMPLAKGTLADKMFKKKKDGKSIKRAMTPMPEFTAKYYFKQMVDGLYFLHTNGIAHKDFKLSNCLIVDEPYPTGEVVKIADFGLSGIRYDKKEKRVIKERKKFGTLQYMSPQILRLAIYDEFGIKVIDELVKVDAYMADVWALGVCLFVMVCADYPFGIPYGDPKGINRSHYYKIIDGTDKDYIQFYDDMKSKNYKFSPNTETSVSEDCLDLIREMIEPDVSLRLRMEYIMNHKWLRDEPII